MAATWSGGGASDINTAANWNGAALLDGYCVHEASRGIRWQYSTAAARWLGPPGEMTFQSALSAHSSSFVQNRVHVLGLTDDYYGLGASVQVQGVAGTWDASNYWTLTVITFDGLITSSQAWTAGGAVSAAGYAMLDLAVANALKATTSYRIVTIQGVKTGSAGSLNIWGGTVFYKLARK